MARDPLASDNNAGDVSLPGVTRLRLRRLHRAASELRRGVPVLVDAGATLAVLAAETADAEALAELTAMAGAPPCLIVPATRAAAILRMPLPAQPEFVAIEDAQPAAGQPLLAGLADPLTAATIVEGRLRTVAPPPGASAAIQLAKISRLLPAVLAAGLSGDAASARDGLVGVAADDVLAYKQHEVAGLRRVVGVAVPLADAPDSRVVVFRSEGSAIEHLAILIGQPETHESPLVRLHSECFTGDLLGSLRCDCGEQLRGAIRRMAEAGAGVLLYLGQEGRGIGLANKLRAYRLQDRGLDTVDANRALGWNADERNFMVAATMLRLLGVPRVRILTNNPDKLEALAACGIEVVGREPHAFAANGVNDEYLATKAARFGHMLD